MKFRFAPFTRSCTRHRAPRTEIVGICDSCVRPAPGLTIIVRPIWSWIIEERVMFGAIKEQVQTVFHRDPAAKSVLEIILCYPGFHAILLHRLAHRLYLWKCPLIPRVISQVSRFFTGIEI